MLVRTHNLNIWFEIINELIEFLAFLYQEELKITGECRCRFISPQHSRIFLLKENLNLLDLIIETTICDENV